MHFCTCDVNLAGELLMVVHRGEFSPVSWPEVEVLRAIHGEDAVKNVKPFVSVEQTAKAEKNRLGFLYGGIVEDIFPGKNPNMEMEAVKAKLPSPTPPWKSPIDKDPALFDIPPEERRHGVQAETETVEPEAKAVKPKTPFN